MATSPFLTVLVLTYNEEENLPFCLRSLLGLGARVVIVDSGSTDRTLEIAKEYDCEIFSHVFRSQAEQVNWTLDTVEILTPWVMRLDADERLTPELAGELGKRLAAVDSEVTGFYLKRRVYFWGRWIRFGGYYPVWLLRVWRNGCARSEQRQMDEHMLLNTGKAEKLQNDIIDENHKGLSFWTQKHNAYAEREVNALVAETGTEQETGLTGQAARKRWMKRNWYGRAPLFYRAFAYWFLRYFVLLGFLDGRSGLVFHFLQGFWYRFLVDAKLYEKQRKLSG